MGKANNAVTVIAAITTLRQVATPTTDRSLSLSLKYKDFIEFEFKYWGFQFNTRRHRGHMRYD